MHIKQLAIPLFLLTLFAFTPMHKTSSIEDLPIYTGNDLGVHYLGATTVVKIWAPTASRVRVQLYRAGIGGSPLETIDLQPSGSGTWTTTIKRDTKNQYYTFSIRNGDKWSAEFPDIYAKAVGVNGRRGMVVDMKSTDPAGWLNDKKPSLKNITDIVLYEMQVRDFSIAASSGIRNKGKFLGFTEKGTRTPGGEKTGLDHLIDLGITHLHLLPSFDFNSVDETKLSTPQYNWGYDPVNYNVPEGSFATDPYDGRVRIKEFKTAVQALHKAGIRVVLDVVYNHTANRESGFNAFAPGYFYRLKGNGDYSDATGCGNETASEREMMRRYMIQSVVHWVKEYHLDGFRFDLMGVHDIETMNAISDTLHKIDPTIFIYGEGWTAGASPLPEARRAVKANVPKLKRIAAFSDDIRDGLHGPFNNIKAKGFVSGDAGWSESVKFGIVASTQHPQLDYSKVNYSKAPWAPQPTQTISYASCHDDHTLYDRLKEGAPEATEEELVKMDRLAQTAVFTSQGVPFLHGGAELLRTKQGVGNSYKSPDSINAIDWNRKSTHREVYQYYKGLIALRKAHASFRMSTTALIQQYLRFLDTGDPLLIAYTIKGVPGDHWKDVMVILNGSPTAKTFALPQGGWNVAADGDHIVESGLRMVYGEARLPGTTGWVLFRK